MVGCTKSLLLLGALALSPHLQLAIAAAPAAAGNANPNAVAKGNANGAAIANANANAANAAAGPVAAAVDSQIEALKVSPQDMSFDQHQIDDTEKFSGPGDKKPKPLVVPDGDPAAGADRDALPRAGHKGSTILDDYDPNRMGVSAGEAAGTKDSKDSKESKDAKDAKDSSKAKDAKAKDTKAKDSKDSKGKDIKDTAKDPKATKDETTKEKETLAGAKIPSDAAGSGSVSDLAGKDAGKAASRQDAGESVVAQATSVKNQANSIVPDAANAAAGASAASASNSASGVNGANGANGANAASGASGANAGSNAAAGANTAAGAGVNTGSNAGASTGTGTGTGSDTGANTGTSANAGTGAGAGAEGGSYPKLSGFEDVLDERIYGTASDDAKEAEQEAAALKDKSNQVEEAVHGAGTGSTTTKASTPEHEPEMGKLVGAAAMIVTSEIGDKTFFIAALMAMRHPQLFVFSSSYAAMVVMTVLSMALGLLLPSLLSKRVTTLLAAGLFLVFGYRLLREGWHMDRSLAATDELEDVEQEMAAQQAALADEKAEGGGVPRPAPGATTLKQRLAGLSNLAALVLSPVWIQIFAMTFFGEWGDRSQIATVAMGAGGDWGEVLIGCLLGHLITTVIAVLGGKILAQHLSLRTITLSGAACFLLFAFIYFNDWLHQ